MLPQRIWQFLLLLFSSVPAFIIAYLGHYSRFVLDDFCNFHLGRSMDAWQLILYYFDGHTASFFRSVLHSMLAPVDVLATSLMPGAIVVLSAAGLYCILHRVVPLPTHRRKVMFWMVSALFAAAATNAFASPQSIYWYNASTGYALPAALLILYVALLIEFARKSRPPFKMVLALAASAMIAFVLGGASEMYVVFQLTFLMIASALITLFLASSLRRRFLSLFLAGGLGTTAALIIHISSPGMRHRAAVEPPVPIPAAPELLHRSFVSTVEYLSRPEAFAGFMLLFGLGLVSTLLLYRPAPIPTQDKPIEISRYPLWLCLFPQLLFLPILWTHVSDLQQIAGRFSYAFLTVVAANLGFIAVILTLLITRKRINRRLRAERKGLIVYATFILLLVTVLFGMTQVKSIHYKAAAYLFFTSLTFLAALGWQLSRFIADPQVKRFAVLANAYYIFPVATTAVLVGAALYGVGSIVARERILAPIAYLQVLHGLIWGAYLAFLIQRSRLRSEESARWTALCGAIGLLLLISVAIGIAFDHARQIPDFARYAEDWDARHRQLIQWSDSGLRHVEIQPLDFDLSRFLTGRDMAHIIEKNCAEKYYNLDSIRVVQS